MRAYMQPYHLALLLLSREFISIVFLAPAVHSNLFSVRLFVCALLNHFFSITESDYFLKTLEFPLAITTFVYLFFLYLNPKLLNEWKSSIIFHLRFFSKSLIKKN